MKRNDELELENANLRARVNYLERINREPSHDGKYTYSDIEYNELEYKLAEAKSHVARLSQTLDDILLGQDQLQKEIEIEKKRREFVEKERDAYEKAYQDSLKHFSRWTKSKMQAISSPELDMKLHTSS
jgi:chromosome segregation ATPase